MKVRIYISQDTKKAKSIPRNELLILPIKKDEEVISYISTNNTEMFSILKKNLHFLTSDQTMRDALSGHYENTPIQIYSKISPPKAESFQLKSLIFFIFLLKT